MDDYNFIILVELLIVRFNYVLFLFVGPRRFFVL